MNMCEIRKFELQIQSQMGEDGIILEVLRRINKKGIVAEVGSGCDFGNCYELASRGWETVFIDISNDYINKLKAKFGHLPNVSYVNVAATKQNINEIVPSNVLFLSIDIDGNDYWIWQAFNGTPLFVVIEINAAFPPPSKKTIAYDENHRWDGTNYHGASLSAFFDLAKSKNYILIGTDTSQINAYFVHKSVSSLFKEESPESVWYKPYWAHPQSNRDMIDLENV